jgi:hypothetical protein
MVRKGAGKGVMMMVGRLGGRVGTLLGQIVSQCRAYNSPNCSSSCSLSALRSWRIVEGQWAQYGGRGGLS